MALRAAQATPLASDVTLHHGTAALLVTSPRAGTVALRPVAGDAAAERMVAAGQGGTARQSAARLDSAGRIWLTLADGRLLRGGEPLLTAPRGATLGGLALSPDGTTLITVMGRLGERRGEAWPGHRHGGQTSGQAFRHARHRLRLCQICSPSFTTVADRRRYAGGVEGREP